MERHANYALVGIVTTLLIMGGLVFAVWLGSSGIGGHDRYRIVFTGPVRGLEKGATVQFNGIKVGEVKRVRIDPSDSRRVLTDISVEEDTPVRADSVASIESEGISGTNDIQITAGSSNRPLLRDVSRGDPPVIRAKSNAMSSLIQGGTEVVEHAREALDRINRLLSDRNVADLSASVRNLRLVSDRLAENGGMIDHLSSAAAKADATMDDARAAAARVRSLADGDGRRAVASAAEAMDELKSTVAEARAAVGELTRQGGALGTSATGTLQSLQRTSDALDGLINDVRQDPRGTLARGPGRERELKP